MNTVELVRKVLDNGQHLDLAKRCLISPCTVRQWKRTGKIKPKGAILIKLQEFLIEQGQQPDDVKILDYPLTDMRVLVAKTKIADQKALANKAGYKDAPDLYVVLRGKHPPSASCREKMARMVSKRRAEIVGESETLSVPKPAAISSENLLLSTLKGLIETALLLVQYAVSDKITADERAKLGREKPKIVRYEQDTSPMEVPVGRILVHLAETYPDLMSTICELVQNGIDENATRIKVNVDLEERTLVVSDNGEGASKEKFKTALKRVLRTMKSGDKLGRWGIGLLSPLGKCDHYTTTFCEKDNEVAGYRKWYFRTREIETSDRDINIPSETVPNFVFAESEQQERGARKRGKTAIWWRAQVRCHRLVRDYQTTKIDFETLVETILDKFGRVMFRNGVVVNIHLVGEDGKVAAEGDIVAERIMLHSNRKSFVVNDALVGFCVAIEEWYKKHGRTVVEENKSQNRDLFHQKAGILAMAQVEELMEKSGENFKDVFEKFKLKTVRQGDKTAPAVAEDDDSSLSTAGNPLVPKEPGEGGGGGSTDDPKVKKGPHSPTVAGPLGRPRKKVIKGGKTGL